MLVEESRNENTPGSTGERMILPAHESHAKAAIEVAGVPR